MKAFKKRELEIRLEKVPAHPRPVPELEQYSTPAAIAADILFTAYSQGDINGCDVVDLGCGTGIFALGSALLGAASVKAIDIDEDTVEEAKAVAAGWDLSERIEFEVMDVNDFQGSADTVIMNPPFGSQNKGADRPFLRKAMETATTVYSLHNAVTVDFLKTFISSRGFSITGEKRYMFDVDNIFRFHTKDVKKIQVVLLISSDNSKGIVKDKR